MVHKFWQYLKGWRGIALVGYMWFILMAYVIVYVDVSSVEMRRRFYIVSVAEVLLLTLFYVCPRLLVWAEHLELKPDTYPFTSSQKHRFFMNYWLLSFGIFFLLYLIFYPGGFNDDAVNQYAQAVSGKYNDWHSVASTLFAYTLPLKLTGGWKGAPILFQAIMFSLSISYMILTLREYSNDKYAKNFFTYIMLNPATLFIFMVTPKDCSFSYALMAAMAFGVRIYFTHGMWLRSLKNKVLLLAALTAGTLFRHNGILFTLPMLLAIAVCVKKKQALAIFVCFLGLVYAIRYPLYDAMNVVRPGNRLIETSGIIMSVIGNAVKEAPEQLDKDVLDFAYSIAPESVWQDKFEKINGFDTIKAAGYIKAATKEEQNYLRTVIHVNVIEDSGLTYLLKIMLKCIKQAPMASLRGFAAPTSIVYGIFGIPLGRIVPMIAPNNLGLVNNKFLNLNFIYNALKKLLAFAGATDYRENSVSVNGLRLTSYAGESEFSLQSLLILCNYAVMVLFKHIFWCIGLLNLIVIIFILARLNFSKTLDWKKLCFALPMLVHNYGTMLLILSNGFRYFYYSYLVFPLVLLVLLSKEEFRA